MSREYIKCGCFTRQKQHGCGHYGSQQEKDSDLGPKSDLTSRKLCVHSSRGSQELNVSLKKISSMAKIRPVLIALVENAAAVQILRSESFHKTRASWMKRKTQIFEEEL